VSFTITNARVFTGDTERPWATSVRVKNDTIVAIDVEPEPADDIIDANGRVLLPAFGDGHAHPMFGGYEFLGPQVREANGVAGIIENVRKFAEENPDDEWIVGGSYETWIVPNGEFDARWLDEAVPDRPVVLRATDYHTVWCNSKALEIAGITAETPNPKLGWIVRRPDGTPMGTLREWDAVDLVLNCVPEFALEKKLRAISLACEDLARTGITWVQDAWVEPNMIDAYVEANRRGILPIRMNLALRANPRIWRAQLEWFQEARNRIGDSEMLSCSTIKFFADGVIEGATAAVREPYLDDPHNHGMPVWDWSELHECVAAIDALGFQPHIHAIGDEGLTEALNAIEHAQAMNGAITHPRPVITHVQMLDPKDIPRFAKLGVVANFEPLWACNDPLQSELTAPRIGTVREHWQYPIRSLLDSGARISMGSDWPVTSHNPLECLEVAVTRMVPGDTSIAVWNPAERISVSDAISAYTAGCAYQAGHDARWGTIAVGKAADLTLLDGDPFAIEPTLIHTVGVLRTWCGGKQIFSHNEVH
jgi:predicted amidohydrolase YtcJ